MEMWWILIYAILATNFFKELRAQELTTSTSTTTVQPSQSVTTITSLVEISVGPSTTLTTTRRVGSPPDTSSQLSSLPSTTSDSLLGSTSSLSPSPTPSSTLLTLPTTSATSSTSTTSSFTGLPTGNFTEGRVHEGLTSSDDGSIIVAAIAISQGCLMGLFAGWWGKRKPFLREPEEDTAWWIHPVYNFRRLLPYADRHTPRRTEPRVVVLAAHSPLPRTRPQISNPIPIHQRPRTPPLHRPHRPPSLTESLMEDMRTSPQPRANPDRAGAVQIGDIESIDNHRSLSPKPLQIVKGNSPSNSGPSGTELEATKPIPIPASARSTSSNYSTFLPLGPPPKSIYLPYRKPDSPPPGRMGQRNLLIYPTDEQNRVPREGNHERFRQTAPFGDEDEDDEEIKRLRREESLRMLEENSAIKTMDIVDEADEDESTSQGSYDFAEARARKVLADKRMREEFARGQGQATHDPSPPPLPELPATYRR